MNLKNKDVIMTIGGGLFFVLGAVLLKVTTDPEVVLKTLPYVLIGFGCGAFGGGLGNIISEKSMERDPSLKKQMDIQQKDERNITIQNFAKSKAYDCMVFVFSPLMLIYALMGVNLWAILLFVFCYLFVMGSSIYYRFKYEKEM